MIDLRANQRLVRRTAHQVVECIEKDVVDGFRAVGFDDQRLRRPQLADQRTRVIGELDDADIFGMVGNACEIERRVD